MPLRQTATRKTMIASALLLGMTSLVAVPDAAAQTALPSTIDPGRVQQDLDRSLQPPSGEITPPSLPAQAPMTEAPPGSEDIRLVVRDIVIVGAKQMPEAKLLPLYVDMLFKEVSLTEIYDLANRITQFYRDNGFLLSRAYVPEQEIRDGVITLRVVEGFISGYEIRNPGRAKDQIEAYAQRLMASGPVNSRNLERYLLLMNDLPGVTVRSVLVPSEDIPDSANIVLTVTEKKLQGYASVDNFGNKFLGPERLTLSGQANSVFSTTDQTHLVFLTAPQDNELYYTNAGFHHNIGTEGTKAGFNVSYAATEPSLPNNLGGLLGSKGKAATFTLDVNHPFIRSRSLSVYGGMAFDVSRNETNYAPGLEAIETRDDQRIIRANTQITYNDATGAYNGLNAILSHGLDLFGASDKNDTNLSRVDGDPNFTKVSFDATRMQHLYGPFSLLLGMTGQYSLNGLLSSEQFGFGGNEFGRGYDSSEITGDHGLGGKMEISYNHLPNYNLLRRYQIYGFYDLGKAWSRTKIVGQDSHESLASVGLGARLFFTDNLRGDTYVAKPLTHEISSRGEHADDLRFRFSVTTNF